MPKKTVHNVRIRPEVYSVLADEAFRRGKTIAGLVNNILEDHLQIESSMARRSRFDYEDIDI